MSVSAEWGQAHPCWVIVDEVHSLHRLPALYETETEGRKYGLKLIQGTQGKTQYEEYYDRLAKAMLAAPKLKLFFRCGESESARWISDTIGEYELEKPKIGTTASVEDKGRDAVNYSTVTEHKQAISKEEIMSLPDLHGYWKYADVVVPFRLPLAPVKIVARGYIPREMTPSEIHIPTPHQDVKQQSASASQKGEQDTKRHEHLIAETEKQLGTTLDVNMGEAPQPDQSRAPEAEMVMARETGPEVLEVGVDPELEAAQIEM